VTGPTRSQYSREIGKAADHLAEVHLIDYPEEFDQDSAYESGRCHRGSTRAATVPPDKATTPAHPGHACPNLTCKPARRALGSAMDNGIETIIQIALDEFRKLISEDQAKVVEIEEIEEKQPSGNFLVTLGYWAKDTKPAAAADMVVSAMSGLMNPWRRKFKRVEVDPKKKRAVAIKMYEPPLGVS